MAVQLRGSHDLRRPRSDDGEGRRLPNDGDGQAGTGRPAGLPHDPLPAVHRRGRPGHYRAVVCGSTAPGAGDADRPSWRRDADPGRAGQGMLQQRLGSAHCQLVKVPALGQPGGLDAYSDLRRHRAVMGHHRRAVPISEHGAAPCVLHRHGLAGHRPPILGRLGRAPTARWAGLSYPLGRGGTANGGRPGRQGGGTGATPLYARSHGRDRRPGCHGVREGADPGNGL